MRRIIILISILILLAGVIYVIAEGEIQKSTTGKIVESDTYVHTKAICNKTNFCEDYEITCKNKRLISMKATGNFVQHTANWDDPRGKNKSILCN